MKTNTKTTIYKVLGIFIWSFLISAYPSQAALTWVGSATNNSWNQSGNWNPSSIPSSTDDVVIPSLGSGYGYPRLDGANQYAKTIGIASGAYIIGTPGATLTVTGDVDISGVLMTGNATISIGGDIVGSGTLDGGSSIINLYGDMTSVAFVDSVSIVKLLGSALQNVNAYTFYDMYINNSGPGLKLVGGPTVTDTLKMISGSVALNGQTFTLGGSAANPGTLVWTSGFFTGPLGCFRRWYGLLPTVAGTDASLFPLGTASGKNRSAWVSGTPTNGGTVSVGHVDSTDRAVFSTPFTDNGGSLLVNVRYGAKWIVSTANSFATTLQSLRLEGVGIPGINDYTQLTMSLVNSAAPGTYAAPTGSNSVPQVNRNSMTAANLNNHFYIASDSSINPLPVQLIYFRAMWDAGNVNLNWETASELNNAYFQVERSMDGATWSDIAHITGAGTSRTLNDYKAVDNLAGMVPNGVIYYRLKQVDFNGEFQYSNISTVTPPSAAADINTWPNPSADIVNVSWGAVNSNITNITIYDLYGRALYTQEVTGLGQHTSQIDISTLKTGTYFLRMASTDGMITKEISRR